MWLALIKRYWQVCTLKVTPAETPHSPLLLAIIAVFFYLLIYFQWIIADVNQQYSPSGFLLSGLSLITSYWIYTFALLWAYRVPHRTVQTLSCLLAGHAIVHLVAFPLLLLTPWLIAASMDPSLAFVVGLMYMLLTLVLTVWQFMISAHIYKQALSVDYLPAVLASFGLLACNILTVSLWR